jgi:hypothetical protein
MISLGENRSCAASSASLLRWASWAVLGFEGSPWILLLHAAPEAHAENRTMPSGRMPYAYTVYRINTPHSVFRILPCSRVYGRLCRSCVEWM